MNCRASAGETRGYPGGSDEGVARSGSGLSYVLAYNSVDSESREPVLQHAMYYRLYHRSWFAGRKTHARHMSLRVAPVGLRDKDCRSITEGCFPAIQAARSHPGNPSGSHLSQQQRCLSRGGIAGHAKQDWQRVRMGHPGWGGYLHTCKTGIVWRQVIGMGNRALFCHVLG